ncbi:hypothetical protein PMJ71_004856 [Escherichia coli]|nr:hypothetical protein [Escherichia coli]
MRQNAFEEVLRNEYDTELVRANFREELVRWYRYRSSSSLPLDELYEHSPAARRYPRDRVLRRLFRLNNEFQRNRIIRSLDFK